MIDNFPDAFFGVPIRYRGKTAAPGRTSLYRCYDRAHRLLYVGISYNAFKRLRAHKRNTAWAAKAKLITIRHYQTRAAAARAEARAVLLERPRHNVIRFSDFWRYLTSRELARYLRGHGR
jgi:excinuclease UvrABC nuclease subunit